MKENVMTRMLLVLALSLALVPAAQAQGLSDGLNRTGDQARPASPAPTVASSATTQADLARLWSSVSGVNAIEAAKLLDEIAAGAKSTSVSELAATQGKLIAQTDAFKKAYAASANGQNQDLDALFHAIIEGNNAANDTEHLARVAAVYEGLLTQYGQMITARTMVQTTSTYRGQQPDPEVLAMATARADRYEANVNTAVATLRGLLSERH
jgi:hypothetical protein